MQSLDPIGLGTMGIDDPATIETAIDLGYRHLDTAQLYDNEDVVGEGIANADVNPEELFVATKVWVDTLSDDGVIDSTERSLDRLGLESIDLLYVHRPRGQYEPGETLPAFVELKERGSIDNIGVSNFEVEQLQTAREHLDAPIVANQVEYHPLYQPTDALADAREQGYYLVAYSPLVNGRTADVPEIASIAEKHDITPETVSLAWLTAKDSVVAIPKASSETHLRANRDAADVALDAEDHARLDEITRVDEIFPE